MSVAVILMALACAAAGAAALELASGAWWARRDRTALDGADGRGRGDGRPTGSPAPPSALLPGEEAPRWARARSADEAAERLLDAAGRGEGVATAAALAARERAAALVVAAWTAAIVFAISGPLVAAIAAVPAGLAGRRLPRLLLRRIAARRAARLSDEAPESLALLAAGAACGLPLPALLATAGEWLDGELPRALRSAARDLDRGAAPARVLAALEREHPVEEVAALVAILERGRDHGVPAAPALKALADGARGSRARRAADRAAKAAPRIQLVAALLLVPAALCMLAAAMLSGGLGG